MSMRRYPWRECMRRFSIEKPAYYSSESTGNTWKSNSGIVEQYSSAPIQPVTLQYLLELGEKKNTRESACYLSRELPKRLARRVKALQNLPFIVGVNPWIKGVYGLYSDAFDKLRMLPDITDAKTEEDFSETLNDLMEGFHDVIPKLAKGFAECGKYMTKDVRTQFLDGMIHARIGIRVLAEHHLALQEDSPEWIGVVHTKMRPERLLRSISSYVEELCEINYGSSPEFIINGHVDAIFPYIPVHIEYIVMELMKNAMRATVEHSIKMGRREHPPVEITISKGKEDIAIRIRDHGGGIARQRKYPFYTLILIDLPHIFEYSFTTVSKREEETDDVFSSQARMNMQVAVGGPMAGLGFGLPMSRIYAKYFGGSLQMTSISGHGCDVFVQLPNISDKAANLLHI